MEWGGDVAKVGLSVAGVHNITFLPYMKVNLTNGNTITIKAPGVSNKNRYIQSVKVNGKPYTKLYFTHKQLTDGAVIEYKMGSKPNTKRGLDAADKPYSMTK